MSVVLASPGEYADIARTVEHLRAQTARERLEIVLVARSQPPLALGSGWAGGFWGHQVVALGEFHSVAQANAAGIRRARAPLVALVEDHSFPQPDWAGRLIEAHRGPWVAVGPVFGNANPRSLVSWADFLIGYGPWLDPRPAGPAEFLAGHNSSYKRAALVEYGDRLEEMLEAETVLHWDLRRRGHSLYVEGSARVEHTNFSRLRVFLPVMYLAGRLFAGRRASGWPVWKRLTFVTASPLIPAVRLWCCARELCRPGRPRHLLGPVLPALAAGLLLDGLGQMLGYLLGPGPVYRRLAGYEFHRLRHVTAEDHRALAATPL